MAKPPPFYHHCITAVEQAAGRDLRDEELDEIFSRVHGRIRRYVSQGMAEKDAAIRAGRELGDDMRVAAAQEKRSALINELVRRRIRAELGSGNETAKLRAKLTGTEGSAERGGVGASTDAKVFALVADLIGPFVSDLREAGLLKALRNADKGFERDIIRELWAVDAKKPPATRNTQARKAAEIISKHNERARLMQNEAGAWIGKLENYVTRQSHDMEKIRGTIKDASGKWDAEANFTVWRDFILPRLDERTFDRLPEITPEAVNNYLRRIYLALASGVHDSAAGSVKWGDVGAGGGPANLAKRVSEERKLIFKDGDAWADYNQRFGVGTLLDAVRTSLEHAGRNTALMRDWGTNPEAMFKNEVRAAMERARDRGDVREVDRLRGTFNERLFDVITGKASVPENLTLAQITVWGQALQTLSKLGGVVLAALPDIGVNAAVLRHNGVGLFESYLNQLMAPVPNAARKEVAALAGVGIDGMLGDIASRFTAMDAPRGAAARVVDVFHRLNLLNWWTNSMKVGVGSMLMHNLARNSGKQFDSLPATLRVTLGRYGITAADWDVARASVQKAKDGRSYILPAHIADDAVRSKFQVYLTDQVREAMTEPDAYSRAIVTGGGAQAGTYVGMAARLLMQFKTYPVTFMRRHWNRERYRGEHGGMDAFGMAHLIVATTLLGYASIELKNMARLRDPAASNAKDFGDYAALVSRALVTGGGLGFYGDLLFGDETRAQGAGALSSFLGPTAATAGDLVKAIQLVRQAALEADPDARRDVGPHMVRLMQSNLPGANLFYLRAALDYLVFYRLQEAMNPGYLARYEARMRQEGTTFMLSPTVSPYR